MDGPTMPFTSRLDPEIIVLFDAIPALKLGIGTTVCEDQIRLPKETELRVAAECATCSRSGTKEHTSIFTSSDFVLNILRVDVSLSTNCLLNLDWELLHIDSIEFVLFRKKRTNSIPLLQRSCVVATTDLSVLDSLSPTQNCLRSCRRAARWLATYGRSLFVR